MWGRGDGLRFQLGNGLRLPLGLRLGSRRRSRCRFRDQSLDLHQAGDFGAYIGQLALERLERPITLGTEPTPVLVGVLPHRIAHLRFGQRLVRCRPPGLELLL